MELKRQMDRCQTAALCIILWMLLQTGLDFQKKNYIPDSRSRFIQLDNYLGTCINNFLMWLQRHHHLICTCLSLRFYWTCR